MALIFRSDPAPIVELETQKVIVSKPYPVYINPVIDCGPMDGVLERKDIKINATLAAQHNLLKGFYVRCINSQIDSSK